MIKVTQGDTFMASWEFFNDDDTVYPINTFTEIAMQLRDKPGGTIYAEAKLSTGELTVSNTNVLNVNVDIPDDIAAGIYLYDIEFHNSNGIQTLIDGKITVKCQITNIIIGV